MNDCLLAEYETESRTARKRARNKNKQTVTARSENKKVVDRDVHHKRDTENKAITSKSVHLLESVVVPRHTFMAVPAYAEISEGTYLVHKRQLPNGVLLADTLIIKSESKQIFPVSIINKSFGHTSRI